MIRISEVELKREWEINKNTLGTNASIFKFIDGHEVHGFVYFQG